MTLQAMPCMLLTSFAPNANRTNPYSIFEFTASKATTSGSGTEDNPFHTNWKRIHTVGVCPSILSAEREFWTEVNKQQPPPNQAFYGVFICDDNIRCAFCFEGQSDSDSPGFVGNTQPMSGPDKPMHHTKQPGDPAPAEEGPGPSTH